MIQCQLGAYCFSCGTRHTVVIVHHVHEHCARFPPVVWRGQVAGIVASVVAGIEGHHFICDRAADRVDRAGRVDLEADCIDEAHS